MRYLTIAFTAPLVWLTFTSTVNAQAPDILASAIFDRTGATEAACSTFSTTGGPFFARLAQDGARCGVSDRGIEGVQNGLQGFVSGDLRDFLLLSIAAAQMGDTELRWARESVGGTAVITTDVDSLIGAATIHALRLPAADQVAIISFAREPAPNLVPLAPRAASPLQALPPQPSAIQPVAEFQVLSSTSRWEYGTLFVIGEIRNNGRAAAGVELEAIARDASGRLVDSATFWPASVNNIPPGATRGFRYPVTDYEGTRRIELRIVTTRQW